MSEQGAVPARLVMELELRPDGELWVYNFDAAERWCVLHNKSIKVAIMDGPDVPEVELSPDVVVGG